MFQTFLRKRYPVKLLDPKVFDKWDLIMVAGPTWFYNPSGMVLSMLDRDGDFFCARMFYHLFHGADIGESIFFGFVHCLKKCGPKQVCSPRVYTHPTVGALEYNWSLF